MMNKISQILDIDLKSIGQLMKRKGRYGDTELAHITPEQAEFLLSLGGAGTLNPATGLPEFYDGDYGGYWYSDPFYTSPSGSVEIYSPAPSTFESLGGGFIPPPVEDVGPPIELASFQVPTTAGPSFQFTELPQEFQQQFSTELVGYTNLTNQYANIASQAQQDYQALTQQYQQINQQTQALQQLNTQLQQQQQAAKNAKSAYDAAYAEYARQSNARDAGTIAGRKAMVMRSYGQSDPPNPNRNGYWEIINANKALNDLKTKTTNAANAVNAANKTFTDSVNTFNAQQKQLQDAAKQYEANQQKVQQEIAQAKQLADAATAERTRLENLAKTEAERVAAAQAQAGQGAGLGTGTQPGTPGTTPGGGEGAGGATFPGAGGGTGAGGGGTGAGAGGEGYGTTGPTAPTVPTAPTTPETPKTEPTKPLEPSVPTQPEEKEVEPEEPKPKEPKFEPEKPKKTPRTSRMATSAFGTPLGGTSVPGGGATGSTAALGAALSIQPDIATTGQEEKKEKGTERELVWNEASLRNILGI